MIWCLQLRLGNNTPKYIQKVYFSINRSIYVAVPLIATLLINFKKYHLKLNGSYHSAHKKVEKQISKIKHL